MALDPVVVEIKAKLHVKDYVPNDPGDTFPPSGTTWAEWLDSKLRQAFGASVACIPINESKHATEIGKELSSSFVSYLTVKQYVQSPPLSELECNVIRRKYHLGRTYPQIARTLNVSLSDVYKARDSAFQALIRIFSANPYYKLKDRL